MSKSERVHKLPSLLSHNDVEVKTRPFCQTGDLRPMNHALCEPLGLIPEEDDEHITDEDQHNGPKVKPIKQIGSISTKRHGDIKLVIEDYDNEDGTKQNFEES
jgi:hypothetical protein